MKNYLLFVVSLLGFYAVSAQSDPRDGRHIFNYDIELPQCGFDGTLSGSGSKRIKANTAFEVRNTTTTDYIIQISEYTKGKKKDSLNLELHKTSANQDIYFKLLKSDYPLYAEKLERRGTFTVGAATTLIKIRPGRKEPKNGYDVYSEFGNDFNIGVSAGWKFQPYRKMQLAHSGVIGLSFSSIKVTPYTTKNFLEAESTQGCVTFSAGYVFEYNKFQVSIFSGLDLMSGQVGRNWIYRNRPWLGLGFGFQIFRAEGDGNKE
jgi:hypothetical protein